MKITIFGTGYVGLVQGVGLASIGHDVTCVDVDKEKISTLLRGDVPIYEPGLSELLESAMKAGNIRFETKSAFAVSVSDVIFIAVGTPPLENGSADLSYVLDVAKTLSEHITGYTVIATKSTVPVGTGDQVEAVIRENAPAEKEFDVVSNPEFLKEGDAVNDFKKPDRIVIGADTDRAVAVMRDVYEPLMLKSERFIITDRTSAELIKYAANAMLATKISFMNEIAKIADVVGADIGHVRSGITSDQRIGDAFLYPGIGYGGSCFPKDVRALIQTSKFFDTKPYLLEAVNTVNLLQAGYFADKVLEYFDGDVSNKKFVVWGLSFKEGTDDVRESKTIPIVDMLLSKGARIYAYDPKAIENFKLYARCGKHKKLSYTEGAYDDIHDSDGLIVLTPWSEFRSLKFELLGRMSGSVIFDGRNLYNPDKIADHGYDYISIGRSPHMNSENSVQS